MPSPAVKLRQRLDGVRRILALDVRMDDPHSGLTKPRKRTLVNELRASCLILPVAYFEEFLRDLVTHFATRLCSGRRRVPWSSLPQGLRRALLYGSGTTLAKLHLVMNRQPSEAEMLTIYSRLASPLTSETLYQIPPEVLCNAQPNPGSESLAETMGRLGVTKVFPKVAQVLPTHGPAYHQYSEGKAIRTKLDDIVHARHRVAHGGGVGNKSRTDIGEQIDFLERLAAALQQISLDHLRSLR